MERANVYGFEMIQPKDIKKVADRERTLLIDLREEESYREGHIKNARNFPLEYIEEWRREIPESISLILYCEHGNQSLLAARKLRGRKGALYTVLGGYQAFLKMHEKEIDTAVFRR